MLVAPAKFKGSASAGEVAAALARGLRRSGAEVVQRPIADGGEGTLDVLVDVGARVERVDALDAFGRPVPCRLGILGRTALVEMADVCRRPPAPTSQDALTASTSGVGAALLAARGRGCVEVVVAVGGSASTDGGAGLLRSLGARLVRSDGSEVAGVGGGLAEVVRIEPDDLPRDLPRLRFAVDVMNPLLGPTGAAAMFAPQKGATPQDVAVLERSLAALSQVVRRQVGHDLSHVAGMGAGGGVAFLPAAFLSAQVCSGAELVLDLLGVDALIEAADVVVTGEGSWDEQSAHGKAPDVLLHRARARRRPVVVVAGRVARDVPDGVVATVSLSERAGDADRAMRDVEPLLEDVGRELGDRLAAGRAF